MANYYLEAATLTRVTSGLPPLNKHLFVGMGKGIAGANFSNYPRGYWGATVVACDAESEEWVLRFDESYEGFWQPGWQFDDPPESTLEFERTGREMVFYGEIEEDDDVPVYVRK
jgi:hypothetical protein